MEWRMRATQSSDQERVYERRTRLRIGLRAWSKSMMFKERKEDCIHPFDSIMVFVVIGR